MQTSNDWFWFRFQIVMSVRVDFADIYSWGMRDRGMRSGTELARKIQLTDWSTAGNLSNRSSGVQIPRDICTRFGVICTLRNAVG